MSPQLITWTDDTSSDGRFVIEHVGDAWMLTDGGVSVRPAGYPSRHVRPAPSEIAAPSPTRVGRSHTAGRVAHRRRPRSCRADLSGRAAR
jgi:hypothetical protein